MLSQFRVIRQKRERGCFNIIEDPYSPQRDGEPYFHVPTEVDAHFCVMFPDKDTRVGFVSFGTENALVVAEELFGPIVCALTESTK